MPALQTARQATVEARIRDLSWLKKVLQDVAHELMPEFAPALGELAVWRCIQTAISDLRGSVSVESLAEMATRLASHRMLAQLAESGPINVG